MKPHLFERVFAPRAVAVLGAGVGGSAADRVLANLVADGFPGPIHVVGAGEAVPPGARRAGSLAEVDGPIDLAIVSAPPAERVEAVRACAERGIAGAIVFPCGPREFGPEGSDWVLERALLDAAAPRGLRLIGPESVGMIRPGARLNASFTRGTARPGSLGLVSQSGGICAAVLDWAAAHRVGFSTVVSLGDGIDVAFGEVLEYLALDPGTRSILLYVESVRSARSFLTGLRSAARIKPVVVVKAGRYGGALGDDAFDAAIARAGAVRVETLEQMFAAARLLAERQVVGGNRLAVLANARGPGLLAADRAAGLGVVVPPLGDATRERLVATGVAAASNPVDLLDDAGPERYRAAVELCLADPEVDAVLALLVPQARAEPAASAEAVVAAVAASARSRKPVIACWMGEDLVRSARALFVERGIPEFAAPEGAVEAFHHLASFGRNQRLLLQIPTPLAPEAMPLTDLARELVRSVLRRGRDQLTTLELRKLFAALGVRDRAAAGKRASGTELWVSVARDPVFGPVIRFGRGGAAGLLGAPVVALPPLDTAIIQTLVRTSRLAGLFTPNGGMGAAERAGVERTLWAVSELVSEVPEIVTLDVGPLVVSGGEVYASDGRAALAPPPPGAGRYDHMAIHPYPRDVSARWQLDDGTAVTVRPIRPEDAEMEAGFVRNLSQSARHFRFMVALKELPREMLIRFTQIDYDRELALVALVNRGGAESQVAVARYAMTAPSRADVAIVVADEWQGRGIGRRLFQMLLEAARARGLRQLEGELLAENHAARALVTRCGFSLRRDPDSPDLLLMERRLE